MLCEIGAFSIATQWRLVQSQICQREVPWWLTLRNLHTDLVTIRSELRYSIRDNIVNFKSWVFSGKTFPFPTVWVLCVVRPVSMVWFTVEPEQEPKREFETIDNTIIYRETNSIFTLSPQQRNHGWSEEQSCSAWQRESDSWSQTCIPFRSWTIYLWCGFNIWYTIWNIPRPT